MQVVDLKLRSAPSTGPFFHQPALNSFCRGTVGARVRTQNLRFEEPVDECEQTYLVRLQIALSRILKTWIFLICRGYGIAELPTVRQFQCSSNEDSGATGRNLQSRGSRVRGYVISSTVPVIIMIRSRSLYISLLGLYLISPFLFGVLFEVTSLPSRRHSVIHDPWPMQRDRHVPRNFSLTRQRVLQEEGETRPSACIDRSVVTTPNCSPESLSYNSTPPGSLPVHACVREPFCR
jgi:hypothetical protein